MNMPCSRHTFTVLTVLIVLSFACIPGIAADEKQTTVSGRVLSAEGEPIPGASIMLGLSTVQTDSEGHFIFTKVTESQTRLSIIRNPMTKSDPSQPSHTRIRTIKVGNLTFYPQHLHDPSRGFIFAITPGANIENVEVIMEYQMLLQGKIVFKNGEPLTETNLKIKIDRLALDGIAGYGLTRSFQTDAEGNFASATGIPGIYMLSVDYRGLSAASAPFVVEAGKPYDGVVLTLDGNATDLSAPPEISKEQERYHPSYISDVPGTWIINPANGHAYKWIACEDREDAQAQAAIEGAHLVTITGGAEQIWLEAVFRSGPYWIGLSDAVKEGEWRWETGEPFFYTNWKPEDEHDRFGFIDEPPAVLKFLGVKGEDRLRAEEGRDYVIMSDWRWDRVIGKWQPAELPKAARMAILEKEEH